MAGWNCTQMRWSACSDLTGLPHEDLFRSREELIAEALARQEEKIAYVNEKLAGEAAGEAS